MRQKPSNPHPQYYKTSDDLTDKMPKEEWSEEVVDGINKALKSAHNISNHGYGNSSNSEIVEIDINVGSPWRLMADFVGTYWNGVDSGTGTFTSACRYMKHYDGSVEFQGRYSRTTAPGFPANWWLPHNLGVIAETLRPAFNLVFPIYGLQVNGGTAVTPAFAAINTAGTVTVVGSDLTGTLPAGSAPSDFFLNFRYMAADPRPYPAPGYPTSFAVKCKNPPLGVFPIACMEVNKNVVRPGPMLGAADWKFSKKNDGGVVTISNLAFSGFNNRIKVWFLVIYK